MRDRIQEAIAIGEKNQRTLELARNWCGHLRVKKHGGTGMVEQMTGLPIGHHFIECAHAPAGGMAAWDLAETALDFHDRNCVGCTFPKAMGFPNLSTLLAEREQRLSRACLISTRRKSGHRRWYGHAPPPRWVKCETPPMTTCPHSPLKLFARRCTTPSSSCINRQRSRPPLRLCVRKTRRHA